MLRDVFYYGEKPNSHPREKFATSLDDARNQSSTEHFWIINEFCDYTGFDWDFDFEFLPDGDVWAEDHNNVWPSVHQKDSGTWLCSTQPSDIIIYRADVAPLKRKKIVTRNWKILDEIVPGSFDFSWHPDPTEPAFIYKWGCKFLPVEFRSCLEYHVPGATTVKYMTGIVELLPEWDRWEILDTIDKTSFDFSWRPDPNSPPYIYAWGTQWNAPETKIAVTYTVPGATQVKYMAEKISRLPCMDGWEVPENVDVSEFDFSWIPNPYDPPFIYQFGTQWQKTGGPRYVIPNATEIKYIDVIKAKALPTTENWVMPVDLPILKFDTSWHPDATESAYIYQFSTQWVLTGGPKYVAPGATEVKYIDVNVAVVGPRMDNWEVPDDIKPGSFDFSWHPHPDDPPFIYQFGTQWQKTGGPRYIAPESEGEFTPVKYIDTRIIKATRLPNMLNWEIPENVDVKTFDFSWHPDATAPNYIYQFGTLLDDSDGPRYAPPDNTGEVVFLERKEIRKANDNITEAIDFPRYYITTTLDELVEAHPEEIFWALNPNLDYSEFDFTWRPSIDKAKYVQAFGSSESAFTQTYLVSGAMWKKGFRDINWVDNKKINDILLHSLFRKSDMFFVDRGNLESAVRFEKLKAKYGNVQKTRFLNSWVDTINRCINRSSTNLCWILNSELDYSEFSFDFYPNPWQINMVHVFGTQWSHWGTTFMVNKETFAADTKYVKIIEHLSNLNFVKQSIATATNCIYDVYLIDHGNSETPHIVRSIETAIPQNKKVQTVPYKNSYLETFAELVKQLPEKKEHYIWVCSSVCHYSNFDFSYICDPFAREQLHVFPSDGQQFGDTFLVNVNKLRELIGGMSILEEYTKINYNKHQQASRIAPPEIITDSDTHVASIAVDFDFPYAVFTTADNPALDKNNVIPMSLWAPDKKNIIITSTGGTRIIVPKEVKDYVETQLYDYPYISKAGRLSKSAPLDIVFLSNGEPQADENYQLLLNVTKGLSNRVVRVDGINGRTQAYHAAAEASNTPWMFTVFAKLKVSTRFDWNWQPDRLQLPKHYIFDAKNPVNGLVYGHQAIIAYNKKLTLANDGSGLDFTMSDLHESVHTLSGVAHYNTDAWSTWRTAFREALKLRADDADISKTRLLAWTTKAEGDFAEYSIKGATDAVSYYEEVNGDPAKLKLSYEWDWLRDKFNTQI